MSAGEAARFGYLLRLASGAQTEAEMMDRVEGKLGELQAALVKHGLLEAQP